jgi:hypothetical protein
MSVPAIGHSDILDSSWRDDMFSHRMMEKARQLRSEDKSARYVITLLENDSEFAGQKMPDERTVRRWWNSGRSNNWVEAYILKHGEPPPVPDWMAALLPWGAPSACITKTMKFKRITENIWDSLSDSQRTQVLEVVDWQGHDRNLLLAKIAQSSVMPREEIHVIAKRKLR